MNDLVSTEKKILTPSVWSMIEAIVSTTATATSERAKMAKQLLFCYECSLPLSLAFNGGLYTVNNRVEVEGTVIRAQIRNNAYYDYAITRQDDKGATIQILRNGELIGEATFEETHAKRAGLLGKENWKNFPEDMYLARATSRAYKRFCPDIFNQPVYVRGEISGDNHVIEGEVIQTKTMQELIDEYGATAVLNASGATEGNMYEMEQWLQANQGDEGDD